MPSIYSKNIIAIADTIWGNSHEPLVTHISSDTFLIVMDVVLTTSS